MKDLQIERTINGQKTAITLTDAELEKAYRIMERRYLDEDFANALADAAQDPDDRLRFHSGHLEEFPEISDWLCACFDDLYDANMGHNDLIGLTLDHLRNESLKPQFFLTLSEMVPAVCMGAEKDMADCEQGCGRYHRCSSIAEANDRIVRWETLASLVSLHHNGNCSCGREDGVECPAAGYLKGEWDITAFFHAEDRKEAV